MHQHELFLPLFAPSPEWSRVEQGDKDITHRPPPREGDPSLQPSCGDLGRQQAIKLVESGVKSSLLPSSASVCSFPARSSSSPCFRCVCARAASAAPAPIIPLPDFRQLSWRWDHNKATRLQTRLSPFPIQPVKYDSIQELAGEASPRSPSHPARRRGWGAKQPREEQIPQVFTDHREGI